MGTTRWLVLAAVLLQVLFDSDLPVNRLVRAWFERPPPSSPKPAYQCTAGSLAADLTVVVAVRDSCSQLPGHLQNLRSTVPEGVHLVVAFPNVTSCASVPRLDSALDWWDEVTVVPLPLRAPSSSGWVEAAQYVRTPYALLLHNDGYVRCAVAAAAPTCCSLPLRLTSPPRYAVDDHFACELVEALKARPTVDIATPLLLERTADRALAPRTAPVDLRYVPVRRSYSAARMLGFGPSDDAADGARPPADSLEDHGFVVGAEKITALVDPAARDLASADLVLTARARGWHAARVPTARLEVKLAEFSWRDLPYFLFGRSEATCHAARHHLGAKWDARFLSRGACTHAKYAALEAHPLEASELGALAWRDQAAVAFSFLQLAGFNRYTLGRGEGRLEHEGDFVEVLQGLDRGWMAGPRGHVRAARAQARPARSDGESYAATAAADVAPAGPRRPRWWLSHVEAVDYLPLAVAELSIQGPCSAVVRNDELRSVCGLVVQHESPASRCSCWVNLPTFKANSLAARTAARVLPSRAALYVEILFGSALAAEAHVKILTEQAAALNGGVSLHLHTCEADVIDCGVSIDNFFEDGATIAQFNGRPPSASEFSAALHNVFLRRATSI